MLIKLESVPGTNQYGPFILLKETTGAFDGIRSHASQTSTDYMADALTTAPRHPSRICVALY